MKAEQGGTGENEMGAQQRYSPDVLSEILLWRVCMRACLPEGSVRNYDRCDSGTNGCKDA